MSTPINANIYIRITYIRISTVESTYFISTLLPSHLLNLIDDFVILGFYIQSAVRLTDKILRA